MSEPVCFDRGAYRRWMAQAANTLESARVDADHGFHNWCCFKAQQAGECAVKAILYGLGAPAIGHSIVVLAEKLRELGAAAYEGFMTDARLLDRHHIPPRYPDAYPSGSPHDYCDSAASGEALRACERIVELALEIGGQVGERYRCSHCLRGAAR